MTAPQPRPYIPISHDRTSRRTRRIDLGQPAVWRPDPLDVQTLGSLDPPRQLILDEGLRAERVGGSIYVTDRGTGRLAGLLIAAIGAAVTVLVLEHVLLPALVAWVLVQP